MTKRENPEQLAVVTASKDRSNNIAVAAGAGTGKTTTMVSVAEANPYATILYVAYNASTKVEAKQRFRKGVRVVTSHGLAYGNYASDYGDRLNARQPKSRAAAEIMGLLTEYRFAYCVTCDMPVKEATLHASHAVTIETMQGWRIASLVKRTLERFCYSAFDEVRQRHVPVAKGIDERVWPQVRVLVTRLAQKWWNEDVTHPEGKLWFWPDVYLKMYQLTKPIIPQRIIVLDEAQDTNDCVWDIIRRQRGKQIIVVGDSNQMIYEWRGSKDVMKLLAEAEGNQNVVELQLTGSYRFGPAVAEAANCVLERLGSDLRLRGYKKIDSVVVHEDYDGDSEASCIIYRTNAGCIGGAMTGLEMGKKVAIVGGGGAIESLARAAQDLMQGRGTDHPELVGFTTWDQVREYCKEEPEDAGSLVPIVKAVDEYGPAAILAMVRQLVDEKELPEDGLTVTTGHKSKGREWDHIVIGDDFPVPLPGKEPKTEELRLAYVAITRGKKVVELGSVGWLVPRAA